MKKFLAFVLLLVPVVAFSADQRIQYNEKMVGANHPTLTDTLNRLMLVEHNTDGTHVDNSISGVKLIDNTADGTKLLDNSVLPAKLQSHGVLACKITNQNVTSSAALIQFTGENYDTDAIHTVTGTDNTKLIVPAGVSLVRLTGQLVFTPYGGSSGRQITAAIYKNNSTAYAGVAQGYGDPTWTSVQVVSPVIAVSAGDYFTMKTSNTAGAMTISGSADCSATWFAMEIVQ